MDFDKVADQEIKCLLEEIDHVDIKCECEIDFVDGGLDIQVKGLTFTVRKQTSAEQIWITSPLSGPYHFVHKNETWQSTKNPSIKLIELLLSELVLMQSE